LLWQLYKKIKQLKTNKQLYKSQIAALQVTAAGKLRMRED